MTAYQVELVDQTNSIPPSQLTQVAAALQQQVQNELAPAWGVSAQVSVGPNGAGAWPIQITNTVGPNELGVHLDDATGRPYALILPGIDWSVTASHELLEMLVDPYGGRLVTAPSIDPAAGGRQVHYLVEVGDPVETKDHAIGGVMVSDFVLPDFYQLTASEPYDEQQEASQPFDVLDGGYISWFDPDDNKWHQRTPNGKFVTAAHVADLKTNFRESRDRAFRNSGRHDLRKIRRMP
jgi:hypothetical protein